MLKYYFEIELIDNRYAKYDDLNLFTYHDEQINNDITELNKIYRGQQTKILKKLHGIFSKEIENNNINQFAISFPRYDKEHYTFGNIIRVFSETKESLEKLIEENNLITTEEYNVTRVYRIPEKRIIGYASYKKVQTHFSTKSARINRYKKRHQNISNNEIENIYKDFGTKNKRQAEYPYIRIFSISNNRYYPLSIKKEFVNSATNNNNYSSFGLTLSDNICTVPEW